MVGINRRAGICSDTPVAYLGRVFRHPPRLMWCMRRKHEPRTILRARDEGGEWTPHLFADREDKALASLLSTYGHDVYDVVEFDKPLPPKVVRTRPRSRT